MRKHTALSTLTPIVLSLVAFAELIPAAAGAQVYAQLGPAQILENDLRLGAFGLAGDDQVGGLVEARFLLTDQLDLGLQFGVRHFSGVEVGETGVDGGIDLRYGLAERSEGAPMDFSAGAGFGITGGDDRTVLTTALQVSASRGLYTSGGRALTPYAGLVISISHNKVDVAGARGEFSDPDLDFSLRLGLEVIIGGGSAITGELQVKEDPALYLGITTAL